jgi:hypothetical protein
VDFGLRLPIAPDRTEVDAIILCGGAIAATFQAPAAEMLDELRKTVGTYVSDACGVLTDLWRTRRADPSLLAQYPKQWKQPKKLIMLPEFHGFPHLAPPASLITSYGVSPEDDLRMRSAALRPDINDVKPDPTVWN